MILKIYNLNKLDKEYIINDLDDLSEIFKNFPLTKNIAMNSFTLEDVVSNIVKYFNNMSMYNATMVDDQNSQTFIPVEEKIETINKNLPYRFQKNFLKYKINKNKHMHHIEKSLTGTSENIRTEDRYFVSFDGDNIGASVERAAMSDDLPTIIKQSQRIMHGSMIIKKWADNHDCDIYIQGGDDVAFTMPKQYIVQLAELKELYNKETSYTVTIGVGNTISQAGRAMLYGKLKGKNQINVFTDEVESYLKQISKPISVEEKIKEHGLMKSRTGKFLRRIKRKITGSEVSKTDIPHVASIAVIDKDKLLMGIRSDNKKWTLPGGHLEPGESPKDGAIRELKEETGIKPSYIFKLGSQRITCADGKERVIHVYGALGKYKTESKNDPDKEVKKWQWVDTINGIHEDIESNLHSPKNVTLQLLGLQRG